MATRTFHVFVRQHQNDAFTVSALTLPAYAAYAPSFDDAMSELRRVLAGELALGVIGKETVTHIPNLERKTVHVTVRAVQHGRLIELPIRVTALYHETTEGRFEVWLPRLGSRFVLRAKSAIEPWTEEVVRGRFHLVDVDRVRAHEHDRGERVDEVEVHYRKIDGKRLVSARGSQDEAKRPEDELAELPPDARVLGGIGSDLVASAKLGELGRAYLRDDVIAQLERVLATGESAVLVGSSGAGKTAIVHELAHRMREERSPLRRPLWHVTASRLMARTPFLGQWQKRAIEVLEAARAMGAILYLENLLEIVQVTQGRGASGLSLPRLIVPFIAQREVTVLVEATPDALSAAESAEPGLVYALRQVPLPSLDAGSAYRVLSLLAGSLAAEEKVQFEDAALTRALDLIARFGDVDGLPGSGLGLIRQMARRGGARSSSERRRIGPEDATEAFCSQTGYPRDLVDADRVMNMAEVEAFFAERIRGQPRAVALLTNVVAVLKAGLDDPERPVGSFLFMGPTGVGKTESALTLAEYLFGDRKRVVRLDMSEYADAYGALRLVDGRRGEGDLTRPLREQPFSVVLLDEIEKAAPEVFDVLLSVLGEGRLTDATGRTASFRHAIVILTSNLGASGQRPIGVGRREGPDYLGAARRFFRPELLNRIDHVVPFEPLDRATLKDIARRLLEAALAREGFARRGLVARFDDALLDHLAAVGFDPLLGARPMKRAIDTIVLAPLAERIARGEAEGKREVYVSFGDALTTRFA